MKIASVQMQPEVNNSKSSVEPKQDEFSNVLSNTITKESKNSDKNESLECEPKYEDNEDIKGFVDSIAGMLNFSFIEMTEPYVMPEELIAPVTDNNTLSIDSDYTTLATIGSITADMNNIKNITEENISFEVPVEGGRALTEDIIPSIDQKINDEKIPYVPQIAEKSTSDKAISNQGYIKNDLSNDDILINQTVDITAKIDEITIQEVTKELEPNEELSVKKNQDTNFSNFISQKDINRTSFDTKIEAKQPAQFNDNMQKINDTIVQLMETTTEGNTNVIKVKLYPEDLGTVNVTLRIEEGRLVAKILVDNDYVKSLFTNKVNELNDNLVKQNIHLEKINIDLNLNSNSNNNSSFDLNQNGSYGQGRDNHSRRSKYGTFNSDIVKTTIHEEHISNSGAISILA